MTTLQLQAYELISKLTDAQLHLIIDLMKDLTSTGESLNNLKNIRRKLGIAPIKGPKYGIILDAATNRLTIAENGIEPNGIPTISRAIKSKIPTIVESIIFPRIN